MVQVTTDMSDVKLSLTQRQYGLLMDVMDVLPRALSGINDDELSPESLPETPADSSFSPTPVTAETPTESGVNLEPELAVVRKEDIRASLDFVFSVGSIALELYTGEAIQEADLAKHSIARFALTQMHVGLKQLSSGAMEAEFSLRALSFSNTRAGSSVFRDIIPPAEHAGKQV